MLRLHPPTFTGSYSLTPGQAIVARGTGSNAEAYYETLVKNIQLNEQDLTPEDKQEILDGDAEVIPKGEDGQFRVLTGEDKIEGGGVRDDNFDLGEMTSFNQNDATQTGETPSASSASSDASASVSERESKPEPAAPGEWSPTPKESSPPLSERAQAAFTSPPPPPPVSPYGLASSLRPAPVAAPLTPASLPLGGFLPRGPLLSPKGPTLLPLDKESIPESAMNSYVDPWASLGSIQIEPNHYSL